MAIGVYVEITNTGVDPVVQELVTAAQGIQAVSKEEIVLLAAGANLEQYQKQLAITGVNKIYALDVPQSSFVQTDVLSKALADYLPQLDLSVILVPATKIARAIFARVAMRLNLGMTADCTSLQTEIVAGRTAVHQIKPSFGAQVLVSCDVPQGVQIITLRPGTYAPADLGELPAWKNVATVVKTSQIEVLGFEANATVNSITNADIIVAAGKGCLEGENFDLVKAYAAKLGAALAGTRPMADNGHLPFEAQIGQSGTVVRPKMVITFGVSGAVQFTEGIKGEPLVIAVNNDSEAAIFGFAQYAAVMDMAPLLKELLQ